MLYSRFFCAFPLIWCNFEGFLRDAELIDFTIDDMMVVGTFFSTTSVRTKRFNNRHVIDPVINNFSFSQWPTQNAFLSLHQYLKKVL